MNAGSIKSWAIDRWENKPISKDEEAFRNGIFTDHVGKLRKSGHGLYAAESFKRRWGMKLGTPDPEFSRLMRGMKELHNAKNRSLYLHIGTGGFEAPTNADYEQGCEKLRGWIADLLKWVKGGTYCFIEHDVQWHLEEVSESKDFKQSLELLRKCIERI